MRLTDLGEKEIVRRLSGILDIGDDAACLKVDGRYLVFCTDVIYGPTHVLPGMTFEQIGRFIVSINLSDIAAMGAEPLAFLLAYAGPDLEFSDFEAMVKAAEKQCRKYGASYAGGDTKFADKLTLTGSAAGLADRPILRSGAKSGDVVCVTGSLGGAAYATEFLLSGQKCPAELKKRALEPEPRVKEGILLREYASSMTDISDGLALSLYDIADQSGVGVELELLRVPVEAGASLDHALFGGADYELLFTCPEDSISLLEKKMPVSLIGRVVSGSGVSTKKENKRVPLERRGFTHFRK